ncbi:MAG: hypothetical protein ACXWNX_10610 [Isosphaeraceae bacterium]
MTNSVAPAEYHDVFQTVRQWPPEARRDLLRDVLKTLHDERPHRSTRGFSAYQVIRLLRSGQPAPTDEECDRILEDELMKKYAP